MNRPASRSWGYRLGWLALRKLVRNVQACGVRGRPSHAYFKSFGRPVAGTPTVTQQGRLAAHACADGQDRANQRRWCRKGHERPRVGRAVTVVRRPFLCQTRVRQSQSLCPWRA